MREVRHHPHFVARQFSCILYTIENGHMDTTGKKIILLIEDDKALNRAVVFKLEQEGYKVFSVLNAKDAFPVLKDHHREIDIIWLDYLLPGMNGLEFLAEMHKNEDYKDIKVVICSVSTCNEMMQAMVKKFNVADYLIKSDYSIDTLVEKVVAHIA